MYFLCLNLTPILNIIITIIVMHRHYTHKLMRVTCFTLKRVSNLDLQCKFSDCFKRIQTVWTSNRPPIFLTIFEKSVETPHGRWLITMYKKKNIDTINKTS